MKEVVLCKTQTGRGVKIVVNDTALYASLSNLLKVLFDESESCEFRPFEKDSEKDRE